VTSSCTLCGATPVVGHHLTGRPSPNAAYLDPDLVAGICQPCHDREHVILRQLGIEWPQGADAAPYLAHRIMRVAVFARRCSDEGRPFVLDARSALGLHRLQIEAHSALASSLAGAVS
jgi:hypothetical protein